MRIWYVIISFTSLSLLFPLLLIAHSLCLSLSPSASPSISLLSPSVCLYLPLSPSLRPETSETGLSDGGLAGVIIAWLLALPFLVCIGMVLYYLHKEGHFDDCYESMSAAFENCQCCKKGNNNGGDNHAQVEMDDMEPRNEPVNVSTRPAAAARNDSDDDTDDDAHDNAARPARIPGLFDPHANEPADLTDEQQNSITTLVTIMDDKVSREEAQKTLAESDWDLGAATNMLFDRLSPN
jgi:hypothetical protein